MNQKVVKHNFLWLGAFPSVAYRCMSWLGLNLGCAWILRWHRDNRTLGWRWLLPMAFLLRFPLFWFPQGCEIKWRPASKRLNSLNVTCHLHHHYLDSKASACAHSLLPLGLNCCVRKLGVCFAAFMERNGAFPTFPKSNRPFRDAVSFQLPHQTANVFCCKMRTIWVLWFIGSKRISWWRQTWNQNCGDQIQSEKSWELFCAFNTWKHHEPS